MLNHELQLRGRNKSQVFSQNLVLNKSSDFLCDCKQLKRFQRQAENIKISKSNGVTRCSN